MLLPVVDQNDNEIGFKERDDLLRTDIHRVSCVWITDSNGRHLLAQRALTKKHSPGKWGPAAAGTVEAGETYESNIVKEIEEELGISLSLEELRKGPKIKCERETSTYFSQWYFAIVDKGLNEFVFQEKEVMALRWFTKEEFREALAQRPEDFLQIIHEHLDKILGQ